MKQVNKNDYNDDIGTLQCDHFDIGTIRYRNNNNLSSYRQRKQVSVLVQVLDSGMSRVEDNIKAYNVVCGMIRPGYVPSVLLVHQVAVIDPVFDITIVSSRSVLHLVELLKKNHLYYV